MTGRYVLRPPSARVVDLGPNSERLVPVAQDVAIARGVALTEAMFHIAAIRSLHGGHSTGTSAAVSCSRATLQDTTAQYGQQAAHRLPGTITVDERPVWTFADPALAPKQLRGDVERLSFATQAVFAMVDVLPAIFNRADSQAERMAAESPVRGLKQLFGSIVRQLWTSSRVDAARPLVVDREAVLGAVGSWFSEVNRVYRQAAELKAGKANRGDSEHASGAESRALEARVLETYAESFSVANVARFIASEAPHLQSAYASL
jgi:hypothetical protein